MIQEIITYIIISFAIGVAVWKTVKKFKKNKKTGLKEEQITMHHNCSNCPADCILRDASASVIKDHPGLVCEKKE